MKKENFKKATMASIGRETGLSVTTVSRCIRYPDKVHPKTMRKIHKAMENSGYIYNAQAARLSSHKSNTIGVLLPSTDHMAFAKTLMAIQKTAQVNNHSVFTFPYEFNPELEKQCLLKALEWQVGGIITLGLSPQSQEYLLTTVKNETPLVVIWDVLPQSSINFIGFDNSKATYQATNFMISLGHKRIAVVTGPIQDVRVKKRYKGFVQAMKKAGLPIREEFCRSGLPTLEEGEVLGKELLTRTERPTAIMAASDNMAIGIIKAAKDLNIQVPEELSVCGFDDIEISRYFSPSLTTVAVPATEIGEKAIDYLLGIMREESCTLKQLELDAPLIVRESTGPNKGS